MTTRYSGLNRLAWEDDWADRFGGQPVPVWDVVGDTPPRSKLRQRLRAKYKRHFLDRTVAPREEREQTSVRDGRAYNKTSETSRPGIAYRRTTGQWDAWLNIGTQVVPVGSFDTEQAAIEARDREIIRRQLPIPLTNPVTYYERRSPENDNDS